METSMARRPLQRHALPEALERLVRATERSLRERKYPEGCLYKAVGPFSLDVRVSKARITRTGAFLRRLLLALHHDDCEVAFGKDYKHPTVVRVDGQEIQVHVREGWHQKQHVMTVEEERKVEAKQYVHIPAYDYTPSGVLRLEIKEGWVRDVQVRWADEESKSLERQVPAIVRGLHAAAASKKAHLAAYEKKQAEQMEAERLAEEERRLRKEEDGRFDELVRRATGFEQSRRVRRFLRRLRERLTAGGSINPGSDLDEWFTWAERRADELDPLEKTAKELNEIDRGAAPTQAP
jgi:hypothetical protein